MKLVKYLYITPLLLGTLAACDDTFEEKPNNEWEQKYIWSVSDIAQGVLNNAYAAIPKRPDNYGENFLDAATDNALTSQYGSSVYKLVTGNFSATNNPLGNWATCYQQFQYINTFLENGLTDATLYDKVDKEKDAAYKKRLRGEAYFLRAFWGFQLLQQYGGKTDDGRALGYPLALHFITEEEAEQLTAFERNTYQECAEQIMKDCDDAIENLPLSYSGSDPVLGATEIGRATQLSAAVLKSKVALYAASPAYQTDACTKIQGMGQFTVINDAVYKSQWETAAKVADEVLKMSGFGNFYALQATDLADAGNTTPAEFVFRVFHNTKELETRHFTPYYLGKANTIPSQNLIDAFPMKESGYPIADTGNSGYDASDPYNGRDNRFYLTVYYHGTTYGGTGLPLDVVYGGKDSPSYDFKASRSGYYLAKFLSKKEAMLDPITSTNAQHYYPILRKAEVFLNFAEAANEAWGPKVKGTYQDAEGNIVTCKYSAYDVIKTIRKASGGITDTRYLDEMAADKESFRELIQNERRLELAFENHRYYDMRRCLLPLNEPVRGVEVTEQNGVLHYDTSKEVEARKFDDIRYYYSPLPYNECVKNPNLVNNLGWK